MKPIDETGILIIDDEENNIRLLQSDLQDAGYQRFFLAKDGKEGWTTLQNNANGIDVILLDRMMPGLDGIELLSLIKKDPLLVNIPVIMQTAATAKEQMLEGIEAGVYYYLSKPYDEETMLAIVAAALRDSHTLRSMIEESKNFKRKVHLIKECNFQIRTLEDARYLATFLSGFYPDPDRIILGLSELLINAIEHGNLGVTFEQKTKLLAENQWEREIKRLLSLQDSQEKYATVYFCRKDDHIALTIKDQGNGFNWRDYLEFDPSRATQSHGRGIALARMMSFDDIRFIDPGNEVHCKTMCNM